MLSGAAVLVVGLLLFEPWALFQNRTVDESLPTPTASSTTGSQLKELARGEFIKQEHATSGMAVVLGLNTGSRVLRLESGYATGWLLPTAGVARLHLLCPDPWPKKRHAGRRLVNQQEFLGGLARVLQPGGEFLLKTDDRVYCEDALASLGEDVKPFVRVNKVQAVPLSSIRLEYFAPRPAAVERHEPVATRIRTFHETNHGIPDPHEAERCFSCGHCTRCDTCLVYCPEGIIDRVVAKNGNGYEINLEYCKGCGICVTECPRGAMEMFPQ